MRLMLDLALNNTGAPISLKDVARRQEISDKYLEQIISVLNRAGYVRSVRGAQGGYLLRKAPEEYTVGMILRLTEGSLAPVACLDEGDDVDCEKREECVTLILWKNREKELEKWPELKESVLSYGLSDFCGRMSSRNENEEIREHILKQLLYFEPRLAADSVSVVFLANPDGSNSVLEFQIQGRIEVGELNEEIVFISKLDLETGTSSLKNTTE